MHSGDDFADAVLASPLGVSWLALLEKRSFVGRNRRGTPDADNSSSISRAVERVQHIPFGTLMADAVLAGVFESGPWIGEAPDKLADAYRHAQRRAPILEAVVERFGDRLHETFDPDRQFWFADDDPRLASAAPRFDHLDQTYSAGELPSGPSLPPRLVVDTTLIARLLGPHDQAG